MIRHVHEWHECWEGNNLQSPIYAAQSKFYRFYPKIATELITIKMIWFRLILTNQTKPNHFRTIWFDQFGPKLNTFFFCIFSTLFFFFWPKLGRRSGVSLTHTMWDSNLKPLVNKSMPFFNGQYYVSPITTKKLLKLLITCHIFCIF